MTYLLDTNICIYIIKKKPARVLQTLQTLQLAEVGISSITVAELRYGVEKSKYGARNRRAVEQFLTPLMIADFDADAAQLYGRIRADLESKGTPIGPLDTLIAAHALSLNVTLVTNNTKEFLRVPGLKVANWAA